MNKYKYQPDDYKPKAGDVIERNSVEPNNWTTEGKLYVMYAYDSYTADDASRRGYQPNKWNVLVTASGDTAKVGDTVMCIDSTTHSSKPTVGTTHTVTEVGTHSDFTWNGWNIMSQERDGFVVLQQAEPELALTDHVIDIANSSLADRLRLRQVLLNNGQELCKMTAIEKPRGHSFKATNTSLTLYSGDNTWTGSGREPTISLQDFIDKYKKSDELRNLAFYKKSDTDWTNEETSKCTILIGAIGTTGNVDISSKYLYDDGGENIGTAYANWSNQNKRNFKNCLQLAYESVFPTEVQTTPEFEYPIYMRYVRDSRAELVVKFTGLTKGIVIVEKDTDRTVGESDNDFSPHTNSSMWQDWNPQFDYDTIMQPYTVVHTPTESEANELLYWAHKQGLKWVTDESLLKANSWSEFYEDTGYILGKHVSKCDVKQAKASTYVTSTIITMDEARNGKNTQFKPVDEYTEAKLPGEIGNIKETTMDKPLLSDLLKQHGAYEKFLANASCKYLAYGSFCKGLYKHSRLSAFLWENSPEGHAYWQTLLIEIPDCINDVRAPDDVEYWQEQSELGNDVWCNHPNLGIFICHEHARPLECVGEFYAEEPIWLKQTEVTTKEAQMTEYNGIKLGNRVTVPIAKNTGIWGILCNQTLTLTKLEDRAPHCAPFAILTDDTGATAACDASHLVLATKELSVNPFKAGDKVRVLTASNCGSRVKGATHTVRKIDRDYVYYKDGYAAHYNNFELVTGASATIETSEPTITKESTMTTTITYTEAEIKAAMTGKKCKVTKPKSDYKLRPAVIADYYTAQGEFIETHRFYGKSAAYDAQAHLVSLLATNPNAKVVPYTVGKTSRIKHKFEVIK